MANNSLAEEHMSEAIALISSTTGVAVFYTLVLILYCLSFRLSYSQLRDDLGKIKRQIVWTMVFQTVLLICATLDVIINNWNVEVRYIDDSTLPGGPLSIPAALSVATVLRIQSIMKVAKNSLILAVLVWRVRVIWSGTLFAIPLTIASVFLYLGYAVLGILSILIQWDMNNLDLPAIPRVQSIIIITAMVFFLTIKIFMTSTIIARLLFVRQKHIELMGMSDIAGQYLSIATMLIESYALDTLWDIGLFISDGLKYAPTTNLFNASILQVNILANFIFIYRVLSGRAWTRQTQDRLSSLRWAPNGPGTTTSGTVGLHVPGEGPLVISLRDSG